MTDVPLSVDLQVPEPELPPVQGTEFTSVEHYDPKVMAAAYDRFLKTDLSIVDIAIDLSVPAAVVARWAKKGGWVARKQEIVDALMAQKDAEYRQLIIEHRVPVMKRHLELSAKGESVISNALDELVERQAKGATIKPGEIKALGDAAGSFTGISARTVGVSDKIAPGGMEGPASGKRPLVILNVSPRADVSVDAKTIEIEEG